MNKLCKACFEEKDILESEEYCSECKASIDKDKMQVLDRPKNYWDKTEQIQFIDGKGYGIAKTGETVYLGEEKQILESLQNKVIPNNVNEIQNEIYQNIISLTEGEKEDGRKEPRTARRIEAGHRTPKSTKRSNKRIRPLHNLRNRRKYSSPNKRSKKLSNNHAR